MVGWQGGVFESTTALRRRTGHNGNVCPYFPKNGEIFSKRSEFGITQGGKNDYARPRNRSIRWLAFLIAPSPNVKKTKQQEKVKHQSDCHNAWHNACLPAFVSRLVIPVPVSQSVSQST